MAEGRRAGYHPPDERVGATLRDRIRSTPSPRLCGRALTWLRSRGYPDVIPRIRIAVPASSPITWVKCQDYGNELEASIAVAILDGSGIPAIVRSNDSVGLFGSGFQGFTAMGVSLMVPSSALAAARTVLTMTREIPEE